MSELKSFFTESDETAIVGAIQKAESRTSGEIRVHITKTSGDSPMDTACKAFEKLGMRETELHNGVLFVLSIEDRVFTILGDDGINEKVPDDFWETTRDIVIKNFKKGEYAEGLSKGIVRAGEQLAEYFPHQDDDVNELPDAISYDEGGYDE